MSRNWFLWVTIIGISSGCLNGLIGDSGSLSLTIEEEGLLLEADKKAPIEFTIKNEYPNVTNIHVVITSSDDSLYVTTLLDIDTRKHTTEAFFDIGPRTSDAYTYYVYASQTQKLPHGNYTVTIKVQKTSDEGGAFEGEDTINVEYSP